MGMLGNIAIDTSKLGWMERAVCKTKDPRQFDHMESVHDRDRRKAERQAQEHCAVCPVREKCLMFGVEQKAYGVYGGLLLRAGVPRKSRGKQPRR